ncbi:MAG: hypothetical protein KGD67_10735 [Candidatus Lokiarchaeota archaeon]|nr:hypothetical protein [Candidatus Lokiarchaeota archaeon]
MDRNSSQMEILHRILALEPSDDRDELKQTFLGLLELMDIYNFDLKEALIDAIRSIEEEQDTPPE